jgi:shikimate kinase
MVQTASGQGVESARINRVYLIGMPGDGKNTIARLVSEKRGWTWLDTDACVTCKSCMTIAEIFDRYGEEEFRKREADCLYQASMIVDVIIATGGGSPIYRNAIDIMRASGIVIFLDASIETLLTRLRGSESVRPLLTGRGATIERQLMKLLEERRKTYEKAHFVIVTDGKSPEEIADEVVAILRERENVEG